VNPGSDNQAEQPDPFAGLVLDEAFIRGAKGQEQTAQERAERARRIAAHNDRLSAETDTTTPPPARGSRTRRPSRRVIWWLTAVAAVVLLGWLVASDHPTPMKVVPPPTPSVSAQSS
jgi:hypothetical protein